MEKLMRSINLYLRDINNSIKTLLVIVIVCVVFELLHGAMAIYLLSR